MLAQGNGAKVGRLLAGETDRVQLFHTLDRTGFATRRMHVDALLGYAYATDAPGRFRVVGNGFRGFVVETRAGFKAVDEDGNGDWYPHGVLYPDFVAAMSAVVDGGEGVIWDEQRAAA